MLDIKFVRENPDVVKENIKKKFQDAKLPLVDELLDKGTVTPDGPERAEIYKKFCDRVNELNPWCYLAIADTLYGANKNLKGVENFYRGSINRLDRIYYE